MDAAEQERELWIASEQYVRGEISSERLEEIELPSKLGREDAALGVTAWRMRWFFIITVMIWLIAAIVAPIVAFIITRSPLSFSLVTVLAPPLYLMLRITKYLFPISDEEYRLKAMKMLQLKAVKIQHAQERQRGL